MDIAEIGFTSVAIHDRRLGKALRMTARPHYPEFICAFSEKVSWKHDPRKKYC